MAIYRDKTYQEALNLPEPKHITLNKNKVIVYTDADMPVPTLSETGGATAGMFNIVDYGANGGNDDSAAFVAAVKAASSLGGTVYVPPGVWRAQNIPVVSNVSFRGAGWNMTTVKLIDGATLPLFKYNSSTICEQAGWAYMSLEGLGTTGPDGIDMSNALSWQFSQTIGVRIWKFKKGIYGSKNDRRPYFSFCQFWKNDVGYYVISNHPQFTGCDIRDNNYGISGLTLYDMQMTNCILIRNNYGIVPDTGGSLSQCLFTNCSIFGNYFIGAKVGTGAEFVGCFLVAGAGMDASSIGIWFDQPYASFKAGAIRAEVVDGWGDSAFVIRGNTDIVIDGVTIEPITNFARTDPSIALYRRIRITNCTGTIKGYFAKFHSTGTSGCQGCIISGNTIEIPATGGLLTTGDGVVDILKSFSSIGNQIKDNVFHCFDSGYQAHAIRADITSSLVMGNIMRNTQGVYIVASNNKTIYTDNILPIYAQGINLYGSSTQGSFTLEAAGTATFNIPVVGARLGDFSLVSFNSSAGIKGVTVWSVVSASDNVTVYLSNNTGTSISLSSGTWRALVQKTEIL